MNEIMHLLYLVVVLGIAGASIFVVYHILRYSLSRKKAVEGALLFITVLLFMLFTNMMLFSRLDWRSLLETTASSAL